MKNIFVRIRIFMSTIKHYKREMPRESLKKDSDIFKLALFGSITKLASIAESFLENEEYYEKYQKQFDQEKSKLICLIQYSTISLKPYLKYVLVSWKLSTYSDQELECFLNRMTETILLL